MEFLTSHSTSARPQRRILVSCVRLLQRACSEALQQRTGGRRCPAGDRRGRHNRQRGDVQVSLLKSQSFSRSRCMVPRPKKLC